MVSAVPGGLDTPGALEAAFSSATREKERLISLCYYLLYLKTRKNPASAELYREAGFLF